MSHHTFCLQDAKRAGKVTVKPDASDISSQYHWEGVRMPKIELRFHFLSGSSGIQGQREIERVV